MDHDLHYFCFFLLYLFFFNMCMSEYLLMQDHECNVCGQNKILDSQELKLEVVESLLMWALGYELRSYVREMPAFSHWLTSSLPLCFLLIKDQLNNVMNVDTE